MLTTKYATEGIDKHLMAICHYLSTFNTISTHKGLLLFVCLFVLKPSEVTRCAIDSRSAG